MAVVIEPGVIGSDNIRRVAELTGLDEDAVMGKLLRLWEASQKLEKSEATATEIGFWLRAGSNAEAWVAAFADPLAGFLRESEAPGHFEIRGNGRHIEKSNAVRSANRERAMRRWRRDDAGGMPAASRSHTEQMPAECRMDAQAKPSQARLNQAKQVIITPPAKAPLQRDEIRSAVLEYQRTLDHFKINRKVSPLDESQIARAVQRHGAETICQIFIGARNQQPGPKFDPAQFVSLATYLRPDKIERYLNLAAGQAPGGGINWDKVFAK